MALPVAGEVLGVAEDTELLSYSPGVAGSGDLESATRTLTAIAKPATPDHTTTLTLPACPTSGWR